MKQKLNWRIFLTKSTYPMKKSVVITFVGVLFIISLLDIKQAITSSTSAPPGYTGAPGTPSCTNCHGGTATVMDKWVTSTIPDSGYIADSTYVITVAVKDLGRSTFGFECSPVNDSGEQIGTMIQSARTTLVGLSKYITHIASSISSADSNSWSFDWIAPSTGSGEVTFYAAFNAANGDGGTGGDIIYHSSLTVQEIQPVVTSLEEHVDKDLHVQFYPNPFTTSTTIEFDNENNAKHTLSIYDETGQLVRKMDNITSGRVKIERQNLKSGLYFFQLMNNRHSVGSGKIMIE